MLMPLSEGARVMAATAPEPFTVRDIIVVAAVVLVGAALQGWQVRGKLRELRDVAVRYPALSAEEVERELAAFRRRVKLLGCGYALAAMLGALMAVEGALALRDKGPLLQWALAGGTGVFLVGWVAISYWLAYYLGRERLVRRRRET